MSKKEVIIPIAFVTLSLLFIAICTMYYLSKGKSGYWLNRKMKIGALLLTLSYFQVNASSQEEICYMPLENQFLLKQNIKEKKFYNLKEDNIVYGLIYNCIYRNFSFVLFNEKKEMVQKGTLIPVDGEFDSYEEDFKFEIDKSLDSGTYILMLFDTTKENQNIDNPQDTFYIFIKNE